MFNDGGDSRLDVIHADEKEGSVFETIPFGERIIGFDPFQLLENAWHGKDREKQEQNQKIIKFDF